MKKEVPMKNYFILALIFLVTVIGVFYAREWYNTSKEYYAQNSVMTKVVREIKSEEIANYTLENQKFVLYVASGKNIELKDFEDKFKNLIQDMDLVDSVLYMNLDGVEPNGFYDLLRNDFSAMSRIKNQIIDDSSASLYVFTDGKITSVLNNVNDYSMKRLESIITRWEIK
ncbi:unknown [Firmicutes bacterium CAG:822]|nr:unknown [Firmicutes bacterium CAG:822]